MILWPSDSHPQRVEIDNPSPRPLHSFLPPRIRSNPPRICSPPPRRNFWDGVLHFVPLLPPASSVFFLEWRVVQCHFPWVKTLLSFLNPVPPPTGCRTPSLLHIFFPTGGLFAKRCFPLFSPSFVSPIPPRCNSSHEPPRVSMIGCSPLLVQATAGYFPPPLPSFSKRALRTSGAHLLTSRRQSRSLSPPSEPRRHRPGCLVFRVCKFPFFRWLGNVTSPGLWRPSGRRRLVSAARSIFSGRILFPPLFLRLQRSAFFPSVRRRFTLTPLLRTPCPFCLSLNSFFSSFSSGWAAQAALLSSPSPLE